MLPAYLQQPAVAQFVVFLLAQAEQKKPLIMRLDGGTRAKVLACLAALIILGFLLIALTWLGARWTRRYMGPKLKPTADGLARDAEWTRPAQPSGKRTRNEKG